MIKEEKKIISKRYLSKKKTASQNISISPSLKEWIERYVRKMHEKNPSDERYKSISAFYCSSMESLLNAFEQGKTLDDFDKLIDKEVEDLTDRFMYKALIPMNEVAVEMNRYTPFKMGSIVQYCFSIRNYFKKNYDNSDENKLNLAFERFKKFAKSNKIVKTFKFDFLPGKGKNEFTGIVEFSGYYKNLHFLNCKYIATILGSFGSKITKVEYTPEDIYVRLYIKSTEWFFKDGINKKQRLKLIEDNLNLLINYHQIVRDNDKYLWIRMAEDNEILLNFENQEIRDKWVEKIEEDIQEFGIKGEFHYNMLEFFERLHWIKIIDRDELSFEIKLSNEKHGEDLQFFLDYFSEKSGFFKKGEKYYLKK